METPFIAHFEGWKGGRVILILVDHEGLEWLISQFERIASIESGLQQLVLGDGHPVESDVLLLTIDLGERNGSQMARVSEHTWHWTVSLSAADSFRNLLSSMLRAKHACHQYFDPDNDEAPIVEVSLGEYPIDMVRRWAAES